MLAATQCGARTPLSPLAQAALDKHLPGFQAKRLMQHPTPQISNVQKADAACLTGKFVSSLIEFSYYWKVFSCYKSIDVRIRILWPPNF